MTITEMPVSNPNAPQPAVEYDETVDKTQAEAKLQRLIDQNQAERSLFKHMAVSFKENRFGPLVFALLFAGMGGFLIFHSSASPSQGQGTAGTGATAGATAADRVTLTLKPSSAEVVHNATVTAEIWEDSLGQSVNAVEADLTYSADSLQFVGIDGAGSAFSVSAQATGGNGKVVIARGTISPLTGPQLLAKVTFKAITAAGQSSIVVAPSSQILTSTTNSNILTSFGSAKFHLTN